MTENKFGKKERKKTFVLFRAQNKNVIYVKRKIS